MIRNRFYKKFIFITFSALVAIFFSSNSYGVIWENTFGGSADDRGNSVQQTTDGGFIITGHTESFGAGGSDVYLIKTDGSGNLVWENTFGGTAGDEGRSVQQTIDGGFIIAGSTESFGAGGRDVYLIKTDGSGALVWEKVFGGSNNDDGNSVQQTTDGGFIIAGSTSSFGAGGRNVYLIKTDGSGNLVWEKTFGGTDFEEGRSVQQTTDGGFIISGDTTYLIWGSVYLIKTDASGNLVWENTFGSGHGYSVQQTTDGGFIIAAGRSVYMKTYFYWAYLIKTDGSGNLVWENTFGEYPWPGIGGSYGYSGQQTTDGGFIIAGWENPAFESKSREVSLIKTDGSGNLVWDKTFGGTAVDEGRSVQQTIDDGYIIAGNTYSFGAGGSDVYLIYYNEVWETVYNELFDSPSDLELLRQYRDEILSNTTKGVIFKTLLYKFSKQALQVLLSNSDLMSQAKILIESNRDAVLDVLDADEGIIYNTNGIVAFLDAYAKKSPPILKILAYIVRWDMLRKQRQGKLFHGFRLK
jgi:hypothetical protein